jgi:hypothetical protein
LGDTAVTKVPNDNGPLIGRLGTVLISVALRLSVRPGEGGQRHHALRGADAQRTAGWIPVAAARPFSSGYVCYAKTLTGQWKIVLFQQPADQ